jgi:uncharacterized protein YyaL (SSP411 family)
MAHETFEDPKIASILNNFFVSIKVDREERPDIDSIYMNAVVAMTGQGGWPMSVFLTPDGEPFYGGTYFPPTRRYGLPSFEDVLQAVIRAWQSDHGAIVETGQKLANQLKEASAWDTVGTETLRPGTIQQAAQALIDSYDWKHGGWGSAPRFPQPMALEFLMMQSTRGSEKALEAVTNNLTIMSMGGLYDVVGGGFHRYSTDDAWLVPHFEKMLYDNAQLALAYLHAYQITGSADFRRVCIETLDFILREMAHPDGGFYSSLDADSEGVEGKYYVWTPGEMAAALPNAADRELLAQVYPVTDAGNFEGKTILQRTQSLAEIASKNGLREENLIDQLDAIHKQLYASREQRVRPGTDDKVLVMWNALALRALSEAARYLHRADYLEAARKNAHFLLTAMVVDGQLMRAWRSGKARNPAYLEDYAGLVLALLALYQTDPDAQWYSAAEGLAEQMQTYFRDPQGGFFDTRGDQPALITRPKDIQDNATPCGNSLAANALLRMAAYSEQPEGQAQAEAMLAKLQDLMVRHPTGFGMWLQAMDFAAGPVQQVAIIGAPQAPETQALFDVLWQAYRPRMVVAAASPGADTPELLIERGLLQARPTAYVCQNFTCKLPVNTPEDLRQQLGG